MKESDPLKEASLCFLMIVMQECELKSKFMLFQKIDKLLALPKNIFVLTIQFQDKCAQSQLETRIPNIYF